MGDFDSPRSRDTGLANMPRVTVRSLQAIPIPKVEGRMALLPIQDTCRRIKRDSLSISMRNTHSSKYLVPSTPMNFAKD